MKTSWNRAVIKKLKAAEGVPQELRSRRLKERLYAGRFLSQPFGGATYRVLHHQRYQFTSRGWFTPTLVGWTEAGPVAADLRARGVKIKRTQQASRLWEMSQYQQAKG